MEDRYMTEHYDEPVDIVPGAVHLSADAMRALKKATGRSMGELLQDDDDDASRFQVMGFAELYRRGALTGHLPDAGELWDRAGRVELNFVTGRLDPTNGEPSPTSPSSAATGE
jgi:hypothetical protein